MDGMISNIQRFSTKDGPGIRTTVFCKGCNLECLWCHNPETINSAPMLKYIVHSCVHCGACVEACSYGAVIMINGRRIYYPEKCIVCGACLDACIYNALEITGSRYTAMELYELLMKDVDYYRASGGGVTFSGGEPLLQTEFLRELSSLLKESGVHVALDTAFSVPWKQVERLLSLVDLILLDIKSMDREKHFAYTGVFPDLIWENAEKLAQTDMKILVRMPLIYGINDGVAEIAAAAAFIQKWEHLVGVELLKYHNLGVDKSHCYGRLKKQQTFLPPSERRMKEIVDIFEQVGISVL